MRQRTEPMALDALVRQWIARHGLVKRFDLAQAVALWPQAVGPQIAAVTRALSVADDGTMRVRVATHAWASELGLMAPGILARLNGSRRGRVTHIRWLVGPLDQP